MRFRSEWSQKNYDPQFGMRGICLECWTVRWKLFEAVGVNVARINLKGGHDGWKSMWTERPWSIATSHPHLRARRVPCRFDKGITRIINYHLQQYSASSCRVAFEDALNAGFFRKKDLSAIPPLAAAHQAIIYALIPTKWLRYVITYPAPLSHLPPTIGCWLVWKLLVADGSVHQQSSHSERRAIVETHRYNLKMKSTNEYISVPTSWPFGSIRSLSGRQRHFRRSSREAMVYHVQPSISGAATL